MGLAIGLAGDLITRGWRFLVSPRSDGASLLADTVQAGVRPVDELTGRTRRRGRNPLPQVVDRQGLEPPARLDHECPALHVTQVEAAVPGDGRGVAFPAAHPLSV